MAVGHRFSRLRWGAAVLVMVGVLLTALQNQITADSPLVSGWPPWATAVTTAGVSSFVVLIDRARARRTSHLDEERKHADAVRDALGQLRPITVNGGALALGVHEAIPAESADDPGLPVFFDREVGADIRRWMESAKRDGGFLVVVGNSSVGKTRLLYETAIRHLGDFDFANPGPGAGEVVNHLAATVLRKPTVVWLDELQRFLPGPYFAAGQHEPIDPAAVRRLLDADQPVVLLGTLWPEYLAGLLGTGRDPSTPEPPAADILRDFRVRRIRLDTFSAEEQQLAAGLAAGDPRLRTAIADRDYNVTEALAGARRLVARYDESTDTQRAIMHASVDATRLGVRSPLTGELLQAAARGYLTAFQAGDAWFTSALDQLCSRIVATAPLLPVLTPDRRGVLRRDRSARSRRHQKISIYIHFGCAPARP